MKNLYDSSTHMADVWWKVEKLHELFSHLETFQPCPVAASHLL